MNECVRWLLALSDSVDGWKRKANENIQLEYAHSDTRHGECSPEFICW